MNAPDRPLVRVEHLLRCWGGAVESIAFVISDSPMLLSLLEHYTGADDFMPLELYSELIFKPLGIELHGYFNRASGYRLQETLKESIGNQWRWLPPRHHRSPWCRSGGGGRTIIPVQRLWFSWDGGKPHPACEQDIQAFAMTLQFVDGKQGFCNDRLLVIPVARSLLDIPAGDRQSELTMHVSRFLADPRVW